MSEKTRKNNDQEDELNQSRFFAERGAEVVETEAPSEEGPEVEEEDILDSKSRFREPVSELDRPNQSVDPESEIANRSPFFGQGFEKGDDTGIRRKAEKSKNEDKASLGS
ncbi:MAG: hypothetical protein Q8922_12690 [Bacteroidota bacterium]|nr:hypothetical protein [Bacteroidota bacterium]MDP4233058.1 hypothetical protein [Bacteroidota bacterium]MDP4241797.1 hypothetical protein [Bacteroidota bacterium]MDP4288782.1 hypothetical protein [Bacteroidota bacterium]